MTDFHIDFEKYLGGLEYKTLKDFEALRGFKIDDKVRSHFPLSKSIRTALLSMVDSAFDTSQSRRVEDAASNKLSPEEYEAHLQSMHDRGRTKGMDKIPKEFELDMIIGPADSQVTKIAAAAGKTCVLDYFAELTILGYPIVYLPLDYHVYNGRAFGMVAIAGANIEAKSLSF